VTSLWSNVAAFVVVPVALWLISVGYGLLIEKLARTSIPNGLLVPLGFCAAIVIALGIYETGAGDPVAIPVVIVPAAIGLLLTGRGLLARLNSGWPLLAAVATFVLFDVGVIATGHWTISFYNVENDSAYELVLIAHLQAHGTQAASGPPSTAHTVISSYLSTGYPLGAQSLLAIVSGLLGISAAAAWQAFMSSMAAVGAIAVSQLSGRVMNRPAAATLGFVSLGAALTYEFALQGSIKEFGTLVGVLAALAVIRWAIVERRPVGVAVSAVPLAAILATFNAAGIPYVAALIGCGAVSWLILDRPRPGRSWVRPILLGGVVLVVLAIPALVTLKTFLAVAQSGYSGAHPSAPTLGPLLRPLPLSEISGVWLYGDYRAAVPSGAQGDLTALATVALLALGAIGLIRAIERREPGPPMAAVTMGLVLLIVFPRVTPYAQAKLLAIASPVVLLCAAQALAGWRPVPVRALGALIAAGIAATVFASDALAYHVAPLLPTNRMLALEHIGRRLGDRGPVLDSEFEQFAKFFALPAQLIDGPDSPTPEGLALLQPGAEYTHSYDLNQEKLSFVESFPYVLTRNSPANSRPPANYRRLFANVDYTLWVRMPEPQVLAHLPVGSSAVSANSPVRCPVLRRLVRGAPAATRLIVSSGVLSIGYPLGAATIHAGWTPNPRGIGGGYSTYTPGKAYGRIVVPRAGAYELWVQGNLSRAVRVTLDGHRVGTAQGSNAPGGWLSAGRTRISAGRHRLGVYRPGGGLGPGDGSLNAVMGAVAVSAAAGPGSRPALTAVPATHWRSLCGRQASWIELVRG
jgi:hypothetical protein